MKFRKIIATLLLISIFSVAKPQRSMIIADRYNKKKDQTTSTTTFLLGSKNGYAYNLSTVSKICNEKQQQQLLTDIFLTN